MADEAEGPVDGHGRLGKAEYVRPMVVALALFAQAPVLLRTVADPTGALVASGRRACLYVLQGAGRQRLLRYAADGAGACRGHREGAKMTVDTLT